MPQGGVVAAPRPRGSRAGEPASLKPGIPTESAESTKAESLKTSFIPAEVADNGTIRVPGRPPEPSSPKETAGKPEVFPAAMRVAFTASEPVWVSIRSDGTRAYTGTIEGQESRLFDASRKMTALVGNAGALQISLTGKPAVPS